MVKTTCKVDPISIPRKELVKAAEKFLLLFESHKDAVIVENLHSPEFGSSEILLFDKSKTNLTIARLNDGENCEKFVISSISYYLWLKQSIVVSKVFLNVRSGLYMYLFSYDFPSTIRYLIDSLAKKLHVYLIKYNVLQVEDLDEPAICFQHMTLQDSNLNRPTKRDRQLGEALRTEESKTSATMEVSTKELSEFNRLKELYLD